MGLKKWVLSLAVLGLGISTGAYAIPVTVSSAPEDDLALTVRAIESAQQTILLNIYELTSADIANALLDRIQHGVQVAILEEGQPVGGLSAAAKGVQSELAQAMRAAGGKNRLFEMAASAGVQRRFRFDHAKYAVIDGANLLIGSENYSPTGNPTPGTLGNRGWEVFVQDAALAQQFQTMFASDCDPTKPDIIDLTGGGMAALDEVAFLMPVDPKKPHPIAPIPPVSPPGHHPQPIGPQPPQPVYPVGPSAGGTFEADQVVGFASPTTSASSVEYLINHATSSIDLELMTFAQTWGSAESPMLAAVLAAAQRGVHVRVLLNDDSVFANSNANGHSSQTNELTVQYLQQSAAQGLPIHALIANVKAMGVDYIHNKGMIVDGNITMISSINWDQNSFQNNRETAVAIQGAAIAQYYGALFDRDWQVSGGQRTVEKAVSSLVLEKQLFGNPELAFTCPQAVAVSARIGDLHVPDSSDSSYLKISNMVLQGVFARDSGVSGCVFTSAGDKSDRSISSKVFLELREQSAGDLLVDLEGYVPGTNSIFSIRAKSSDGHLPNGALTAGVYEGTGTHSLLGKAEIEVHASN